MRKEADSKKDRVIGLISNAAIGSFIGLALSVAILLGFSIFIASGKIPENLMKGITIAALFIGSFIGTLVAVKRYKRQALVVGLTEGGILFFITLVCGALWGADTMTGEITLPLLLAALLGGALGSILFSRPRRRKI